MDVRMKLALEAIPEAEPIEPHCVSPMTPFGEIFSVLAENCGGALVCHNGMLVGIFTERDAVKAMAGGASLDTPIARLMTVSPVTVRQTTSLATAVRRLAVGGYRRLPILDDDGRPCGVVTVAGLVHYLTEQFAQTVYTLPPLTSAVSHEREGP